MLFIWKYLFSDLHQFKLPRLLCQITLNYHLYFSYSLLRGLTAQKILNNIILDDKIWAWIKVWIKVTVTGPSQVFSTFKPGGGPDENKVGLKCRWFDEAPSAHFQRHFVVSCQNTRRFTRGQTSIWRARRKNNICATLIKLNPALHIWWRLMRSYWGWTTPNVSSLNFKPSTPPCHILFAN